MEEKIQETIEVGVTDTSVKIPLKVTMLAEGDSPSFDYTVTIDELGQIVVTPSNKTDEFTSVDIDTEFEERETPLDNVTYHEETNTSIKEFNLVLDATMLTETVDKSFTTIIDDIGQIVVQPLEETNTFVTVTTGESLDLVTESLETHEYLGYILMNHGDGWDVINSDGDIEEEGLATLAAAKVFVCKQELKKLTEELDQETDKDVVSVPEVSAEVLEESSESDWVEYAELCSLTDNFNSPEGIIECDDAEEQEICAEELSKHYLSVATSTQDGRFIVTYSNTLNEEFSDLDIIDKLLKGDVSIFEGEGTPEEHFIPLTKLNTPELKYYYDSESGSVVTFKVEADEQ